YFLNYHLKTSHFLSLLPIIITVTVSAAIKFIQILNRRIKDQRAGAQSHHKVKVRVLLAGHLLVGHIEPQGAKLLHKAVTILIGDEGIRGAANDVDPGALWNLVQRIQRGTTLAVELLILRRTAV